MGDARQADPLIAAAIEDHDHLEDDMELKNKLVVGLMSAMLAFTGLACAGDDTAEDIGTDTGVEAPAEGVEEPADGAATEEADGGIEGGDAGAGGVNGEVEATEG